MAPVLDLACRRSGRNYAHQLASALELKLTDASCGGATTANILAAPQRLPNGDTVPAQIDAVAADARQVTITIGGNDLDLNALLLVQSCGPLIADVVPPLADAAARVCSAAPARPGPPRPSSPPSNKLLTEIVRTVHAKALRATVLFSTFGHQRHERYLFRGFSRRRRCRRIPPRLRRTSHRDPGGRSDHRATAVSLLDAENHTSCDSEPRTNGLNSPFAENSDGPGSDANIVERLFSHITRIWTA
ncbi:GDSL-type esterase/lipase family protein [Nocardia aurea]|uniref:GDSL-type esterase/lipase family protein n=1 Tax=Nocardia aurea TaxID=2144174 RepID=UPI000D694DBD|nr:GDSL-type esterase/lipase family protein [Nocardia aurea]